MDIKEFYKFGSKLLSSTMQVHMDRPKGFLPIAPDERRLMDEDRLMQGVYNDFIFPIVFKQEYGKKLQDMFDTGTASLYLISDKMKTVLEDNHLTGWQTFAVKVFTKKGEEISGYHGLSITGRCGEIDDSKSEIIEKRLVPNGTIGRFRKGLYVGLDKWDGSDFFLPEKYLGTIVTSRAAEILNKSRLTNIRLQNLADIEILDFT